MIIEFILFWKTTNTFKLSESHSNCGDASAINFTDVSNNGSAQTITSQGKYCADST